MCLAPRYYFFCPRQLYFRGSLKIKLNKRQSGLGRLLIRRSGDIKSWCGKRCMWTATEMHWYKNTRSLTSAIKSEIRIHRRHLRLTDWWDRNLSTAIGWSCTDSAQPRVWPVYKILSTLPLNLHPAPPNHRKHQPSNRWLSQPWSTTCHLQMGSV